MCVFRGGGVWLPVFYDKVSRDSVFGLPSKSLVLKENLLSSKI